MQQKNWQNWILLYNKISHWLGRERNFLHLIRLPIENLWLIFYVKLGSKHSPITHKRRQGCSPLITLSSTTLKQIDKTKQENDVKWIQIKIKKEKIKIFVQTDIIAHEEIKRIQTPNKVSKKIEMLQDIQLIYKRQSHFYTSNEQV